MEITEFFTALLVIYILFRIINYIYRYPYISGKTDRYVFITGCDSGFGFETAVRLDKYGMFVLSGCLTEKGETRLKEICSERLKTFRLDVSDIDNINEVFRKVQKEIPPSQGLWGLINNAGILELKLAPFDWLTTKDYTKVMEVNLFGMINMVSVFLPLLKTAKGRIVNTSSIAVHNQSPYMLPYGLSKYGVNFFSNAIRKMLNPEGVSVHIIEPQTYNTPIVQGMVSKIKVAWDECPLNKKQEYGIDFYHKFFDFFDNLLELFLPSENTYEVVDAYEHALLARYPKPRYAAGWQSYILSTFAILPDWLVDWIQFKMGMIYKHGPNDQKKKN